MSSHCGLVDPISSNWQRCWRQSFSLSRSDPPRFLSTSVPLGQIRLRDMIQIILLPASQLLMLRKDQHQHRTLSDESPVPVSPCALLQCLRLRAYDAAYMRRCSHTRAQMPRLRTYSEALTADASDEDLNSINSVIREFRQLVCFFFCKMRSWGQIKWPSLNDFVS